MQELRFAVRQLWKSPAFTIAAVLTLALGVGANTAVFSFINAVLWRPLPYLSAGHLVRVSSVNPGLGISDARTSDPNIVDWAERNSVYKELAAFQEWDGTLTISGRSTPVRVNWVTPNLLSMLGVQPVLGRLLLASDVNTGVLLPYGIWEQHNRDPEIIGRKVKLDGEVGTVVGILPPKTVAPTQGLRASDQVFIASDLRRTGWPRSLQLRNVVGELKPGISVARAQEDLSRVATVLEKEFPETNRGWGVLVTDLKRWKQTWFTTSYGRFMRRRRSSFFWPA